MLLRRILVLILAVFIVSPADAQKKRPVSVERRSTERELARIREEIKRVESQLREHERQESRSRSNITAFRKRGDELRARIALLRRHAADLESQLSSLGESLDSTQKSLQHLSSSYAADAAERYRTGLYRNKQTDIFFSDPNVHTEQMRLRYFARLASASVERSKITLDSTSDVLADSISEVSATLDDKRSEIEQTSRDARLAQQQQQQESKRLEDIQKRKIALQQELDRRRADAKKLESFIQQLIAKEEAERKAREEARKKRLAELQRKKAAGKKLSERERRQEKEDSSPITEAAGPRSLSWPVASRQIVQGFGEVRNKELGTVTVNLGIDIATPRGSAVRAAEDGIVAIISSLPSYGTIVIVAHSGGVHTVYADLASVSVSRGDKVDRGDMIGTSGENSELGPLVHFEVWKGRAKQNPMGWLR
jgi:septal ring factor EnvC (AmiA/AmiB activator)